MTFQGLIEKVRTRRRSDAKSSTLAHRHPAMAKGARTPNPPPGISPVYNRSTAMQADPCVVKSNRCICIEPDSPEVDAYKILRTRIQKRAQDHDHRVVMITSPTPGDGKTLTSVNLALTMARAYDQTVMLVDCDAKRQDVHKYFGIESGVGLRDHLIDDVPLEDVIIWPGIDKLSFISGGVATVSEAEALGSSRMKCLVDEMKSRYADRIVLLDTPPVLSGADTLALVPLVDCIILVVAEGRTNMKDVFKSLEVLPEKKLLGFVMNRQKEADTSYPYYYR